TRTRKAVKTAVAISAPDRPRRRASARSSTLARSTWYLTSWVRSLIASETRSPTDRLSFFAGLAVAGSTIALFPPAPGCWVAQAVSVRHTPPPRVTTAEWGPARTVALQ